ncbi:PQQ-binding-like beta-propeller repeat protein [Halobacillus sp. BBL2006]|uniref:outer membrane protein assembly factor BamB family protein n=1 Tax=Halobacillus sp. BBL2006 TaxID=1543706 RepID=UPI00068E704A|nr:PQQ-binding-like beta-propeller repeat protein [Halobacillus sp. BBL2006]
MKKTMVFITAFLMTSLIVPTYAGAAFGPGEWLEYRLNDANNPVSTIEGADPLSSTTFQTGDEIRSTPVVVGDRLFAGNHNTGELFAFDIHTGKQLWKSQAPNWVHSEMIYQGGTIYVGYGNRFFQDRALRGTEESGVLALNAETGEVKWNHTTDGEVMPTPLFHDGYVYAATGDTHLYKLDAGTGEEAAKIKLGSVVSMSSPNYSDGSIFVGGGGPKPYTFYSVNVASEEINWKTEFDEVYAGLDDVPPAIDDQIIITTALETPKAMNYREVYNEFGTVEVYKEMIKSVTGERETHPEHMIYAMDTKTGEVLWKDSLGVGEMVKNNKSGAPMIYEGKVFVGSPITEKFYAYDLKTGERLWEFKNTVMKAPPVAADGTVYFSNAKGFVHAMDAASGEELGRKKLGGTLAPSGPIIVNDTLIVGSQDSHVYALPTGEIKNSKDEYKNDLPVEKSQLSYFSFVYGPPVILLIAFLFLLLFFTRRAKRKNR